MDNLMPAALIDRDWDQIIDLGVMECSDCGETKPLEQMRKRLRSGGQFRAGPNCNDCNAAAARRWFRDNRQRATTQKFRNNLHRNYGMTIDDYETMLVAQDYVCAICDGENGIHSTHGTQFRLSVDHDHKTGRVRGLLCNNCNRALGLLADNHELVRKALAYIERQ